MRSLGCRWGFWARVVVLLLAAPATYAKPQPYTKPKPELVIQTRHTSGAQGGQCTVCKGTGGARAKTLEFHWAT
jgi:hypothetical protein